jgi:hypothetical protein
MFPYLLNSKAFSLDAGVAERTHIQLDGVKCVNAFEMHDPYDIPRSGLSTHQIETLANKISDELIVIVEKQLQSK